MNRIVVIVASFKEGTGGVASLRDFVKHSGPPSSLSVIEVGLKRIYKVRSLTGLLLILSRIKVFRSIFNRFLLKTFQGHGLLLASNFEHDYQEYLTGLFDSKFLNHPASVKLMMHWQNMDSESYANFTAKFGSVIFQADVHLQSYNRITGNRNGLVLYPTVDETMLDSVIETEDYSIMGHYATEGLHVVIVGTLIERKGQFDFIERLISCGIQNVTVHLVGSSPDIEYLKSLKGLKYPVQIHGHSTEFLYHMKYASIVVNWSLEEGVSRVLREALYLGKNIVASDISGNREALFEYGGILINRDCSNETFKEIFINPDIIFETTSPKEQYYSRYSQRKYRHKIKEIVES